MVIKKRPHPRFRVPNLGAKSRKKVQDRWRAQRGTDNHMKLKRDGYGKMPSIGYKNSDQVRYARPDGSREVLIRNEMEMMGLINAKNGMVARLSHDLSRRKRTAIQALADAHAVRIVNRVKI